VIWEKLRHGIALDTLHNARYAGAFCFGKTRSWKDPEGKYETENAWPWSAKTFSEAVESVHFENSRPMIMLARMLRGHLKGELPNRVAGSLYA
jgi:hypothetical protein